MSKIHIISFLFGLSLAAFLLQTEITQYLYSRHQFSPILLLFLTHGSWATIWPAQLYVFKFKETIHDQLSDLFSISQLIYNNYYGLSLDTEHTIEHNTITTFLSNRITLHVVKNAMKATAIITCASLTWYIAMVYSYSNDVTAIYNCCAFFAYLFAVPILKEQFSKIKMGCVVFAIAGVFSVVYGGANAPEFSEKPLALYGNLLILAGSILYGYYDVFYKKYLCPPEDTDFRVDSAISSKYSNFVCSLIGCFSIVMLLGVMLLMPLFGLHVILPTASFTVWGLVALSVFGNLCYSASMLILYALTSPVLGAVSSLTTIFLVGVFEWMVWGVSLNFKQIVGDCMIILGFAGLLYAYWNDIS